VTRDRSNPDHSRNRTGLGTAHPIASRVQLNSRTNTWLKTRIDPEWVYGNDAWREPLATLN
jgi:hypothetical protein